MEPPYLATLVFSLAAVFSAPFLTHAFNMKKERNYREMAGSVAWPGIFFTAATVAMILEGSMPIRIQNTLLILFGGLLGPALAVWGGNFVRDNWSAKAQTSMRQLMPNSDGSVTGMTIDGDGKGGTAASVSVTGSPNQTTPPVGLDINAAGAPGQSVTGLKVIQSGPGTGLKVEVGGNGPATGVRVIVGPKP